LVWIFLKYELEIEKEKKREKDEKINLKSLPTLIRRFSTLQATLLTFFSLLKNMVALV